MANLETSRRILITLRLSIMIIGEFVNCTLNSRNGILERLLPIIKYLVNHLKSSGQSG